MLPGASVAVVASAPVRGDRWSWGCAICEAGLRRLRRLGAGGGPAPSKDSLAGWLMGDGVLCPDVPDAGVSSPIGVLVKNLTFSYRRLLFFVGRWLYTALAGQSPLLPVYHSCHRVPFT